MQVNQVYSKRNSVNTDASRKEVLQLIIDSIEGHTGDSTDRDPPHVKFYLMDFLAATKLPDIEDAKHILSAWILNANYFLTTDYSSILNVNDNHQIENFFDSHPHPILGTLENVVKIRHPVLGLSEIMNNNV